MEGRGGRTCQDPHDRALSGSVLSEDSDLGAEVHPQPHFVEDLLSVWRHLRDAVKGEDDLPRLLRVSAPVRRNPIQPTWLLYASLRPRAPRGKSFTHPSLTSPGDLYFVAVPPPPPPPLGPRSSFLGPLARLAALKGRRSMARKQTAVRQTSGTISQVASACLDPSPGSPSPLPPLSPSNPSSLLSRVIVGSRDGGAEEQSGRSTGGRDPVPKTPKSVPGDFRAPDGQVAQPQRRLPSGRRGGGEERRPRPQEGSRRGGEGRRGGPQNCHGRESGWCFSSTPSSGDRECRRGYRRREAADRARGEGDHGQGV